MLTIEYIELTEKEYFSGTLGDDYLVYGASESANPTPVDNGLPVFVCPLGEAKRIPYVPGRWYKAVWAQWAKLDLLPSEIPGQMSLF